MRILEYLNDVFNHQSPHWPSIKGTRSDIAVPGISSFSAVVTSNGNSVESLSYLQIASTYVLVPGLSRAHLTIAFLVMPLRRYHDDVWTNLPAIRGVTPILYGKRCQKGKTAA